MFELKGKNILIVDIETDSLDVKSAKLKWFGAYSFLEDKYYEISCNDKKGKITSLLQRHKNIITFNGNEFDIPIIERNLKIKMYQNKIDLLTISRQRLPTMGVKVKDYSLRTIAKELKLNESKGSIDYTILQKDNWSSEEENTIREYLKQDIKTTKELFEYFNDIFQSTVEMLSKEDVDRLIHIKASPASLSYRAILNNAGIKYEFGDNDKQEERQTYEGAHHIEPRENSVKGNIISIDFASMYPHMVIMCNLLSPKENGWSGNDFIKLQGKYNNINQGKIEQSLNQILLDRLEAKKNKNKPKNMGFKVLINAFYGTLGNNCFKTTYNPTSAGDCTRLARTILKRLAKTLDEYGFKVLYGFTDSVIVLIPEESNKEELIFICNKYIKEVLSKVPFPKETFKLEIDKEMKFIKFFAKNCYLYVTQDNKIENTSTLLNKNTPQIVMKVFKEYITPKIIRTLDCDFTEQELKAQLLEVLKDNPEQAGEEFSVKPLSEYKVKSSLEYQISEKYGPGKYILIPNLAGIGVGKAKGTKKRKGLRYCTYKEFLDSNLTIEDIDINRLVSYIKPFYKKEIKEIEKQTSLT